MDAFLSIGLDVPSKISLSKSIIIVDQPILPTQILISNLFFSPDCTCVTGFHDLHTYRSGEAIKTIFSEASMMTPRDSTGVVSDNELQRTGELYPAQVSSSLWTISQKSGLSECE